jgi:hypothetical protein
VRTGLLLFLKVSGDHPAGRFGVRKYVAGAGVFPLREKQAIFLSGPGDIGASSDDLLSSNLILRMVGFTDQNSIRPDESHKLTTILGYMDNQVDYILDKVD